MFGSGTRVGIWLADGGAEAALVQRRRKGWTTLASAQAPYDFLLADAEQDWLDAVFGMMRRALPKAARRADTAFYLAVPDRHVIEETIHFDAFPDAREEAAALVRQRCARELGRAPGTLAISHEVVAREGRHTVRVRVMDKGLRDRIEIAAERAGFRLNRIDGWLGYASASGPAADASFALWADHDHWTLACVSASHPQGFSDTGPTDDDIAASDVARIVRSYCRREDIEAPVLEISAADPAFHASVAAALEGGTISCREMALPAAPDTRAGRIAAWA